MMPTEPVRDGDHTHPARDRSSRNPSAHLHVPGSAPDRFAGLPGGLSARGHELACDEAFGPPWWHPHYEDAWPPLRDNTEPAVCPVLNPDFGKVRKAKNVTALRVTRGIRRDVSA